jgi:DNA polymerase-3 subunit delta
VRETLQRANVKIDNDALSWVADQLGGDRLVTRGEIEKLALYVGAGNTATLADARALIGDSAEIGFDDLANATAGGDVAAMERARARLEGEGIPAIAQLRVVQRHFTRLHLCSGMIAAGRDEKGAMMALRPPVFWKEEAAFKAQLRRWNAKHLARALERLLDAEIRCKSPGAATELIAARCLTALATTAARS